MHAIEHHSCLQLVFEDQVTMPYYHLVSANRDAGLSPSYRLEDEKECCLRFDQHTSKLLYERPGSPPDGEVTIVYLSKEAVKRTVIENDYDLLSSQ